MLLQSPGRPNKRPNGGHKAKQQGGAAKDDRRVAAAERPSGQGQEQPKGERAGDQVEHGSHCGEPARGFEGPSRLSLFSMDTRWTKPPTKPRTAPAIVAHG